MATGDLTSLANVKAWIGVTTTTDDALLTRLVSAVSTAVQNRLNRTIASTGYTETRNGNGRVALQLTNYPVTAVASVTVDTTVIAARTAPTAAGFTFDERLVYLQGYCFTKGQQNVAISYTAGYAATPLDLEQATIEICALKYQSRTRIGLGSKGLAGETTTFLKDVPPDLLVMIDQYKRVLAP